MAEAVAAFYAVETVAEGAAAGALAVSGATVPLHARFQKIKSPSQRLALTGSTINIVKNKVYILGGQREEEDGKHGVNVLSFPPDFGSSRTEGYEPIEVDYEFQEPELSNDTRPLEKHSDHLVQQSPVARDGSHRASWSRTQHASVAINDQIYVLGGLHLSDDSSRSSNTGSVIPLDTVLAFDTLKNVYTTIPAEPSKCTEGLPEPRYGASCTSSPYPPPISVAQGQGPSLESHGTIFLHGGHDLAGSALHDTWTFDIGTRAWHKFPSIVDTVLQDKTVTGRINYIEHRLWYINGSTVMHLDLAEHDPEHNETMSQDPATLSTGRVGSGQWQVVYPSPEHDPAKSTTSDGKDEAQNEPAGEKVPATPKPPTPNILQITTGAGRNYLLSTSVSNPQNMNLFQIISSAKTATSIKDTIRDKASEAIKSLPDNWKSGKHEWSKVDVVQSSMKEGEIERPDEQLSGFSVAAWEEYGDKVILWGGQSASSGVKNEGWIVSLS